MLCHRFAVNCYWLYW